MQTTIVEPKKYTRERFQQTAEIPAAKGGVESSANIFQWMLFKPQAHAIPVFEMNQSSRADNTQRSTGAEGSQ